MSGQDMDERFAHVMNDPRFRTLRKSDKKVKIDNRFGKMFTEKKFQLKSSVDKRGKHTKTDDDYKKLYDVSDDDHNDDKESAQEVVEEETKKPLKRPQLMNARGIDSDEDSEDMSSSSESEVSEGEEDEEMDHKWNEWDKDVPQTETATKRVAICNIDWDRINATDLFVVINSFKPSGGSLLSVAIYPSELGLQRMKAEAESGPIQFIKRPNDDHKSDNDSDDDNEELDDNEGVNDSRITEQLRQYEMTKLKYFYAVVECDSEATADALYNELDGMEYESSSSTLDLRFIPEDMEFSEVEPKSECRTMPDLSSYVAPQFINSALQQSKVHMTWDQTDPKRRHVFERAFNKDEDDDDLKAYLATSDEEDEDEDQQIETPDFANDPTLKTKDKINKYKDLLNSLNEPKDVKTEEDKGMEMEITWEPDLKDKFVDMIDKKEEQRDISVFQRNMNNIKEKRKQKSKQESDDEEDSEEPEDSEEELNAKKIEMKTKLKSKKRKKGERKHEEPDPELELLLMDSDNDDKKHFNYKNIVENQNQTNSKKRKQETKDTFNFNAEDPRFGAVYTSHHYNVDPSDPHFKKTEAFDKIMSRTTKTKKSDEEIQNANNETNGSTKSSWTQLVRTVKNKTELIHKKSNRNKFTITQNKFKS